MSGANPHSHHPRRPSATAAARSFLTLLSDPLRLVVTAAAMVAVCVLVVWVTVAGGPRATAASSAPTDRSAEAGTRPAAAGEPNIGAPQRPNPQIPDPVVTPAPGLVNPRSEPLKQRPRREPADGVAFPVAPPELAPSAAMPPASASGPAARSSGSLGGDAPDVAGLVRQHFPAAEWDRALAVAECESGLRNVVSPANTDGSRDYGIFQLNSGGTLQGLLTAAGHPESQVELALDASWNVAAAASLWRARGWQPWVCAAKLGIVAGLYSHAPGPAGR